MADVKISALPVATGVLATDVAPIVNSGLTTKATAAQIVTAALNANKVTIAQGGTNATDAATARTNLGLGSIATQASSNVSITGGTMAAEVLDIDGAHTADVLEGKNELVIKKVHLIISSLNFNFCYL